MSPTFFASLTTAATESADAKRSAVIDLMK
jgi:hypothetical protein